MIFAKSVEPLRRGSKEIDAEPAARTRPAVAAGHRGAYFLENPFRLLVTVKAPSGWAESLIHFAWQAVSGLAMKSAGGSVSAVALTPSNAPARYPACPVRCAESATWPEPRLFADRSP